MILLLLSLRIVASTTDIGFVLETLGKGIIDVHEIVPGGMCPGHFDLSLEDAKSLALSDIIICHGWEGWLKKVEKLKPHPEIVEVKTKGNWMVPEVLKKAGIELKKLLEDRIEDTDSLKILERNWTEFQEMVDSLRHKLDSLCLPLKGRKAVCNQFVKEQLEHFGMEVLATFPPGDELNPALLKDVISMGKDAEVVVENLQSKSRVGETISKELNIPCVTISNFPLNNDYPATVISNVETLVRALSE